MMKNLFKNKKKSMTQENAEMQDKLKAHNLGDLSLTITTIILVIISLNFNMQFAPFIILLMSSRIGTSIYIVVKTASKREFRKLLIWCTLFMKSTFTCWQFFTLGV